MREYDSGAASAAELYFSNENNESATRSEEEFVITHSHPLFAAVAPLAASEFKKTLENVSLFAFPPSYRENPHIFASFCVLFCFFCVLLRPGSF